MSNSSLTPTLILLPPEQQDCTNWVKVGEIEEEWRTEKLSVMMTDDVRVEFGVRRKCQQYYFH